jgi:hypothetical protein
MWVYFVQWMVVNARFCKEDPDCWHHTGVHIRVVITVVSVAWFAAARLLLYLVPSLAAYVHWSRASGRGLCRTCISSVALRDGPHYTLLVAAGWLFLKLIFDDPKSGAASELPQDDPEIQAVHTYAFVTLALSVVCFFVGALHNSFLDAAFAPRGRRSRALDRAATRCIVDKLATRSYDPAVFGDEDGKAYPAVCAICLCCYDTNDEIKVTPCGHAFHSDCIAIWLDTAHTCALCRADLAEPAAGASAGGPDEEDVV